MTDTYGTYGGRYVPETLVPALDELTEAWEAALADEQVHLAQVRRWIAESLDLRDPASRGAPR